MHLADLWLDLLNFVRSTTGDGPTWWQVLKAILGAGAVFTFISWSVDRFRTRSRFGVDAAIDDAKTVSVRLRKKGDKKATVEAVKVVVVKPRRYRWARLLIDQNPVSPIQIAELDLPEEALEPDQTHNVKKTLSVQYLLPPPLNPFGKWADRECKRSQLRIELSVSNRDKPRYIRCHHKPGGFV